jgi:hypothetical protein
MQGCYIGRQFDGDITTVACSNAPGTLVATTSYLYWLAWGVDGDSTRGTLVSALKTGGALRPLAVIEDSSPTLLASGTHLFWTDWKVQKDDRAGVVGSVPLQGGPATTLADDLFLPNGLALDETYAYFGTVDGIFRVPQSGGDVEFIADALAWRMQVVDGMAYWLDHKSVPTELGLRESMAIFRVSVGGGKEPELLLRTFDRPGSLIVVGDRIFWTTNAQGEIWSMPLAGGTPTVVLENPFDEWDLCCSLTSDGTSLFLGREGWPNDHPEKDGILRVSLDGAEVEEVMLGRFVDDVAVDDNFVYFTGSVGTLESRVSGVFRMPK